MHDEFGNVFKRSEELKLSVACASIFFSAGEHESPNVCYPC